MNFEQAMEFRGINPRKPIEIIFQQWHWYGILSYDEVLYSYRFYGILKGNPDAYHFAPVATTPLDRKFQIARGGGDRFSFEFLVDELFGTNHMPDIDDDETLWKLQRKNPFIGTTQYPDHAMAMRNIATPKLLWLLAKDCWLIWKLFGRLIKNYVVK